MHLQSVVNFGLYLLLNYFFISIAFVGSAV